MGQRLRQGRSAAEERMWLSALVEAMEEVSRPEFRFTCCDRAVLEEVRRHLARPPTARMSIAANVTLPS